MSVIAPADLTRRLERGRGACVLVAIKQRARCKTRLRDVLAPAARITLVRSMLAAVLAAAARARLVRQILVISPERDCVPADIPVLADDGTSLNDALLHAHALLREFGCREFVILPADLPMIGAADIDAVVLAGRAGGFAIAPDAAGMGTNALYLGGARPFRFQFGPDSRQLHLREAQRLGAVARVLRLPGLACDVDSSADLGLFETPQWHARLRA